MGVGMRLSHVAGILLAINLTPSADEDLRLELGLEGEWLIEIGDNPGYAQRRHDDSEWETVKVPSAWENQGFPGYDGYAWYRKHVTIPEGLESRKLLLRLGRIDDVDAVYVNGYLLGGTGDFPPQFRTAWNVSRRYLLPSEYLRYGKDNTLAVRVYDDWRGGGIYDGDVGIFSYIDAVALRIDLSGIWRFKTGDSLAWAAPSHNHSSWADLTVPGLWEKQGFAEHDGFAWYRRSVVIDRALARSKLILVAGAIDDRDEVYFNGELIGKTGKMPEVDEANFCEECYRVDRAYFIPPALVRPARENVVAIRVFDHGGFGGVWTGSVGITTRQEFLRHSRP